MSEAAAAPRQARTSPFGIIALGMVVAVLGGMALSTWTAAGVAFLAIGAMMAQFGVIASAVELAIVRARDRG